MNVEEQTEGCIAYRVLPDGRVLTVMPMLFTARLTVSQQGVPFYDDGWCYHSTDRALFELGEWDGEGEPTGWHRHPTSGRRRDNGDPATEYVRL